MAFAGCTRRLVGAWLALCPLGCQAILGDFHLEEEPAVSSGLGTTCEPSAFRCNDADLEACRPDRRGWQLVTHCASAGQCDASAAACRTCTPGEAGCNDGERQLCTSGGELENKEDCGAPALCILQGDRSSARCGMAACDPGAFFCDGNRLRTCAPERDHWKLVARCASVPLCNAASAVDQVAHGAAPTCLTPLCLPGTFACDGATPERCSADQNAWEPLAPCADAASCNASDGSCNPAPDGTFACSGADLVQKAAGGFVTLEHCASPFLCDATVGECNKSDCGSPGTLRCNDDELPKLEECSPDGTWVVREVCDAGALCSVAERRCFPAACAVEGTRCVGQAFQRCSADLTHWQTETICGDDQSCGTAGCEAGGCTNGARCVETSAEVCSGGHWAPRLRCATAGLCLPASGSCGDPLCGGPLGEYQCTGDERLQSCPPDRKQWNTAPPCPTATPFCDPDPPAGGGAPVCEICEPLAYACVGTSLTRCAADGQSSPTIASCPGGCAVTAGVPSCLGL